jgi:hypothetical protein
LLTKATAGAALDGSRDLAATSLNEKDRIALEVNPARGEVLVTYLAKGPPTDRLYIEAANGTSWADARVLFRNPKVLTVGTIIHGNLPAGKGGTGRLIAAIRIDRSTFESQDWPGIRSRLDTDPTFLYCLADQRFLEFSVIEPASEPACP